MPPSPLRLLPLFSPPIFFQTSFGVSATTQGKCAPFPHPLNFPTLVGSQMCLQNQRPPPQVRCPLSYFAPLHPPFPAPDVFQLSSKPASTIARRRRSLTFTTNIPRTYRPWHVLRSLSQLEQSTQCNQAHSVFSVMVDLVKHCVEAPPDVAERRDEENTAGLQRTVDIRRRLKTRSILESEQ